VGADSDPSHHDWAWIAAEKIMTDPQLRRFDLIPTEHQRPGRPHGWAKIHSETAHGAINLEWHGRSSTLICRVVTN